jgi:hypothetical protein
MHAPLRMRTRAAVGRDLVLGSRGASRVYLVSR